MQFSLAILALPLLALAKPLNISGEQNATAKQESTIEARQFQPLNITALMDCVEDIKTQACGKAVTSCIQIAINQITG